MLSDVLKNLYSDPYLKIKDDVRTFMVLTGSIMLFDSFQIHYAHRSVLAAASAYFNAMFTSDVLEAKRDRIVIQSLDSSTLASLLDFMYTGQIRVTNENVQELLIAGDMIELREVVEICTDHLVRQLEPSNALGIFRFAADHNCLMLKEAALRYVCTNFVQVSSETKLLYSLG